MKIELKRIAYSERLSEETNAFSADLYIEGKKAGTASNRGHGGPTDYDHLNDAGRTLIKAAEEYCKALPAEKFTMDGEEHTFPMSLESKIDQLLESYLDEKENKKFLAKTRKWMENGFVIGIPFQSATGITFKTSLNSIITGKNGSEEMVRLLQKHVLPELKDGKILLNTNIPEGLIREAGIKEGQYTATEQHQQKPGKTAQKKL